MFVADSTPAERVAAATHGGARSPQTQSLGQANVRGDLLGADRSGTFVATRIATATVLQWAGMGGVQASVDLFFSTLQALYVSHFYIAERSGRVVFPVIAGQQFQVVGVDSGTGLESFAKVYDPDTVDARGVVVLESPDAARNGPYPVFGSPFRVEVIDLEATNAAIETARGFTVMLGSESVTATKTAENDRAVTLLNVTSGLSTRGTTRSLSVGARAGDRVVLLIEERDVDPESSFSIVFDEKVVAPGGASLGTMFAVETALPGSDAFVEISDTLRLDTDSGGRRVLIRAPASLARGNSYRLRISRDLQNEEGLKIGQVRNGSLTTGGLAGDLYLHFTVRKPAGELASFEFEGGVIRDQALNGNVLLIAGGPLIAAYDVSEAAAMNDQTGPVLGNTFPRRASDGGVAGTTNYWSIASDHHGRVYATGLNSLFGVVQSFRLEHFLMPKPADPDDDPLRQPVAGAIVSYAPGAAAGLGLASRMLSTDRPEAYPRKLQILLQDHEESYDGREEFKEATNAAVTATIGDVEVLTASFEIVRSNEFDYITQRFTVENLSRGVRVSADARPGAPAQITGIVAGPTDELRVLRNETTYGVIALFGYGLSVYDLNAMESNGVSPYPSGYRKLPEQIRLTSARMPEYCSPDCGNVDGKAIQDLTFTPDATIITRPGSTDLDVLAVDAHHGVLDLVIQPPLEDDEPETADRYLACTERAPVGLVLRNRYFEPADPCAEPPQPDIVKVYDHPRLLHLRELYRSIIGRDPAARFGAAVRFHARIEAKDNAAVPPAADGLPVLGQRGSLPGQAFDRDYLLIPGNEYGLLVVEVGGDRPVLGRDYRWLDPEHLADLIWFPHGVNAVRAVPRTNLVVVVDGAGFVHLADLSRIDERKWGVQDDALFDTARAALESGALLPGNRVGLHDPRIVWTSEEPLALQRDENGNPVAVGTLAPIIDPNTGLIFLGKLLGRTTHVVSAVDPRIQVKADIGAANGLSEIGGIVPLGVDPPDGVLRCDPTTPGCNASLAAFRLEVTLPGAITEKLEGGKLIVAVESESVLDAPTMQTPDDMPRAHLRRTTRGGVVDPRGDQRFAFERAIPLSIAENYRHQSGYNRFISPWIVAIADPRASVRYDWGSASAADKKARGCRSCDRPAQLRDKTESDGVWELYTNGTLVAVRPDLCASGVADCASNIFSDTPYSYLADGRLNARFPTVMADTVRVPASLVAAQNPPVADGMLQETTYVHSGEVESSSVDLNAGGRAGWDVVFDRTYRSQTIGATPLGEGWTSSAFRRLRALPSGDVEYRDGAGETWLFRPSGNGYRSPAGFFARLTRTDRGWLLADTQRRFTSFDESGRLTHEADEFASDPYGSEGGNVIRYLYDVAGRLVLILDPLGRRTTLAYFGDEAGVFKAGRLRSVTDWRGRVVDYDYDAVGRLTRVDLPEVENTDGTRPRMAYAYESAGGSFNDLLELRGNLKTITDPGAVTPRLTLEYGTGLSRDRATRQAWATGEAATFFWSVKPSVTDALGQQRIYELSDPTTSYGEDRVHVKRIEELAVETMDGEFGSLPTVAGTPTRVPRSRVFTFDHESDGLLKRSSLEGVSSTSYTWKSVPGGFGRVLQETTTAPFGSGVGGGASAGLSAAPITRRLGYDDTFVNRVESISGANTQLVNLAPAHGRRLQPVASNDEIEATQEYDRYGQLQRTRSTGGTDLVDDSGAEAVVRYEDSSAAPHRLGMIASVQQGELKVSYDYPSPYEVKVRDAREVETTTTLDQWLRPKRVVTSSPSDVQIEETARYDAAGRLKVSTRRQGDLTVTTTSDYDVLGRILSTKTDNVAVLGSIGSVETKVDYDIPARTIVRTLPGGAVVTEQLDTLGRVRSRTTTTGSSDIHEQFAYDLAGNLVYSADDHVQSAAAFDAHGRLIDSLAADRTRTLFDYDPSGNPTRVHRLDRNLVTISDAEPEYTSTGRLESVRTRVADGVVRTSQARWDGAGRVTKAETSGRASERKFDASGRMTESAYGKGSIQSGVVPAERFAHSRMSNFDGALAKTLQLAEKGSAAVETRRQFDSLANVTSQTLGSLEWRQQFDQAGNVESHQPPALGETSFEHDARGNVLKETLADQSKIEHGYDASGAPAQYTDQVQEVTRTTTDNIGRPLVRYYADFTTELFEYEGARLKAMTDRQRRRSEYRYDPETGQLRQVRVEDVLVEELEYDAGGYLRVWRTADAELVFEDHDLEGRPRKTRQRRFADRSGFAGKELRDEYVQTHDWSEHGERAGWTMPAPTGFDAPGWTARVDVTRDAAGYVESMTRTLFGSTESRAFMTAAHRGAGRPDVRTLVTTGGAEVRRSYGYRTDTGQLDDLTVTVGGRTVAGAHVEYDGLQAASIALKGVSGGKRANYYSYDDRGRLRTSASAREEEAVPATEVVDPADFREALERPEEEKAALPSLSFAEQAGHKIAAVTRGEVTRTFDYAGGAERVDDGRFVYQFDARGRLIRATEKPKGAAASLRRIHYAWSAHDRVVGRRAEYAASSGGEPEEGDWRLEDRAEIVADDGLPADVTFVWDPMSDQLAAVYGADGRLLRQILHGENAYDDPVEVAVAEGGAVHRLYPLYDEAGTGGLQAVLNERGELVSRTVVEGAYGEDEFGLAGAAVDHIELAAKKNAEGELSSVAVSIRVTEAVDESTLASGARLAAVRADGTVVRSSDATAQLIENYTIRWTLTAAQWRELVEDPAGEAKALSVAVTSTLRAAAWSDATGILPPPDWATTTHPIHTTPEIPVEYREPLTELATWITAIGPDSERNTVLFDALALSALAGQTTKPARLIVASAFQALPFAEPVTGLVYARARWYDPSTGSFLTPDPMGYRDSSNLYAFAGGDPVNGRDPTGRQAKIKRLSGPSEKITALDLVNAGWKVLRGETGVPHNTFAPGEDVLAFKKGVKIVISPEGEMFEVAGNGTVLFVDDKNLGRSKAYSATALNENFDRGERVRKARELIENSDQLTDEERAIALRSLDSGEFTKAVMAGAGESNVRAVGPKLLKKGIGFLPKTNLGKGLLGVSLVLTALANDPAAAAVSDLTGGGPALNENEADSLETMLALTAVADELNRRQFIGPPTPPHLERRGASGRW